MNNEDERPSIMFDNRLREYRGFFTGEKFSREAMQLASSIDGMKRATNELVITWRSASVASALPFLLVDGLVRFHGAFAKPSGEIDTRIAHGTDVGIDFSLEYEAAKELSGG